MQNTSPQNGKSFDVEDYLSSCNPDLPEGSVTDDVLRRIDEIGKTQKLIHTAETGCGRTTVVFSRVSQSHTVFAKVDSSNRESLGRDWIDPSKVSWVVGPTQKTLPTFAFTQQLDFVLIDGPHGYPFPELEYYYLYPHLKEGAWLVIDDIHIGTIQNFFRFLMEDSMYSYSCTLGNTAFFRRTEAPTFDPYGDGWWEQGFNVNHVPWKLRTKLFIRRCCPWTIRLNSYLKRCRTSRPRPGK
jgi:hypothetical protein